MRSHQEPAQDPSSGPALPDIRPSRAAGGPGPDASLPDTSSLLGEIVENSPVAILVCDAGGGILLLNREAEALFGYPRQDLLGRSIEILVPATQRERHPQLRTGYLDQPSTHVMGQGREVSAQRQDGSLVPVEIALRPIEHGGELRVIATVADVSERKRMEREIREARDVLEQRVQERTLALEQALAANRILLREIEAHSAELELLSRQDPLTGLANRRDFDQRLAMEIERSQRQGLPLAAAMLDLDHFKLVNDRCGHAVGDAVLRQVADLIRQHCRRIDLVSRYGGEEFALALPASSGAAAAMLCERIRAAMLAFDWRSLHPELEKGVTLSAGVSELHPGMNGEGLLSAADDWLYAAKRGGRNRVMPEFALEARGESERTHAPTADATPPTQPPAS